MIPQTCLHLQIKISDSDSSVQGGYDQGNSSQQRMYDQGNDEQGGDDYFGNQQINIIINNGHQYPVWGPPWLVNKEKGKNFFIARFLGYIFRLFLIMHIHSYTNIYLVGIR